MGGQSMRESEKLGLLTLAIGAAAGGAFWWWWPGLHWGWYVGLGFVVFSSFYSTWLKVLSQEALLDGKPPKVKDLAIGLLVVLGLGAGAYYLWFS